jgi:hypothetical protein
LTWPAAEPFGVQAAFDVLEDVGRVGGAGRMNELLIRGIGKWA